jgi:hypothetical protein
MGSQAATPTSPDPGPGAVSCLPQYGPAISEFRHVACSSVEETTYFMVSFMKGAPGSSAAVRADHAGSNISYVARPSRIPSQLAAAAQAPGTP